MKSLHNKTQCTAKGRRPIRLGLLIVVVFMCAALTTVRAVGAQGGRPSDRPNVLMIVVDDLNDWIGCLGGHPQAKTPNIDRLAERGVAFSQAQCSAPICGPSRASCLSGIYPFNSGLYVNSDVIRTERPDLVTLPQYLMANDYRVIGGGKLFHGNGNRYPEAFHEYGPRYNKYSPFTYEEIAAILKSKGPRVVDRGPGKFRVTLPLHGMPSDRDRDRYDSIDWGSVDVSDDEMSDTTLATWAIEQLGKTRKGPFFLGVGFYRPHVPMYAPAKYHKLYPLETLQLPTVIDGDLQDLSPVGKEFALKAYSGCLHQTVLEHGQWRSAVASYLACVSFVDAQIGRILDALDRSPYAKDTVIVLWGDNGWHLGEKQHWGKWVPWRESTQVPLVIVPADTARPPGFKPDRRCNQCVSLVDIYPTVVDLCGLEPKEELDGQSLVPLLTNPQATWDQPAITTFGRGNHAVFTNRWQLVHYFDGSEELYDGRADPHQWHNLIGLPEYAQTQERLALWLPKDEDVAHFVRYGPWKAVIFNDGKSPKLYDNIGEVFDVSDQNATVLTDIMDYLETNHITAKHVTIAYQKP